MWVCHVKSTFVNMLISVFETGVFYEKEQNNLHVFLLSKGSVACVIQCPKVFLSFVLPYVC